MPVGNPQISRAVLVTGCSSGIGLATAVHLARRGWPVYASARQPEQVPALAAAGCRPLALDVTDEASMQRALATIEAEAGAVGVLVNNAGYSQSGALESVSMGRLRAQFETNVFGPVRLAQLVLPAMRRQGWGKIVNVSSIGGKLTFPGGGAYHASKHAVEALSDALRFEVRGFGVDVIVIEPGLIRTAFADAVSAAMTMTEGPYAQFNASIARGTLDAYTKGSLARLAGGPDEVARVIEQAISATSPRSRYRVTASARVLLGLRRLLPDRLWDAFLRTQFPSPRTT